MVKKALFIFVVMAGFAAAPRPALAGCTHNLLDCYGRAAKDDSIWYRWADGLDCELAYTGCVRQTILG